MLIMRNLNLRSVQSCIYLLNTTLRFQRDHFKVLGLKNLAKTGHFITVLVFSTGKIHTLHMSSGALKYQIKQKGGSGIYVGL